MLQKMTSSMTYNDQKEIEDGAEKNGKNEKKFQNSWKNSEEKNGKNSQNWVKN